MAQLCLKNDLSHGSVRAHLNEIQNYIAQFEHLLLFAIFRFRFHAGGVNAGLGRRVYLKSRRIISEWPARFCDPVPQVPISSRECLQKDPCERLASFRMGQAELAVAGRPLIC